MNPGVIVFVAQIALSLIAASKNPSGLITGAQIKMLVAIQKHLTSLNQGLEQALLLLQQLYAEQKLIPGSTIEMDRVNKAASYWLKHLENSMNFYDPKNLDYLPSEFLDDTEALLKEMQSIRFQIILISEQRDFSPILHLCTLQQAETMSMLDMMSDIAFEENRAVDLIQLRNALQTYVDHYDACLDLNDEYSLLHLSQRHAEAHKKATKEFKDNQAFSTGLNAGGDHFVGCQYSTGVADTPEGGTLYQDDPGYDPWIHGAGIRYARLTRYHYSFESKPLSFGLKTLSFAPKKVVVFDYEKPFDEYGVDETIDDVKKLDHERCKGRDYDTDAAAIKTFRNDRQQIEDNLERWNQLAANYASSLSAIQLIQQSRKQALAYIKAIDIGDFSEL